MSPPVAPGAPGPLSGIRVLDLTRAMYVELPHPTLGVLKTTGVPVKLSRSPGAVHGVPPELGADTDACLAANGFSADEIAALRAARVI